MADDYDIYGEMKAYLQGAVPLSHYLEAINRQEWIYPENYIKLRFLENHDQARAHFLIPDGKALRNFLAFSFFQKGTAFLYAGQEFGAMHRPDLFERDPMACTAERISVSQSIPVKTGKHSGSFLSGEKPPACMCLWQMDFTGTR